MPEDAESAVGEFLRLLNQGRLRDVRLGRGRRTGERAAAMPAGPVKWTAYLHPSGVRYRTRLVGVPRVRQYGRRLLAMPARYCGLTAHAARPASPGMYAPRPSG
ncbi:hypothetical protein C5746_04885 [Streptomyces atratus]|uniref:Uncharacterized protein n=1 Tax=Streptomyces atratus TaxID=1893 RepID=A0A2Z5J7T0_STRAR|nr:hypothetical protein C5746_04885 [Streptomyces atratus]